MLRLTKFKSVLSLTEQASTGVCWAKANGWLLGRMIHHVEHLPYSDRKLVILKCLLAGFSLSESIMNKPP